MFVLRVTSFPDSASQSRSFESTCLRRYCQKALERVVFSKKKEKKLKVGMKFPPLEVQLLRKLPPHPNLMQLFDIVEAPNEIYLVQEFVNGCELFEYCAARKDIPEKDCQILFVQIVRGVSWLHKHGIAHRDLSKIFFFFCLFSE